MSQQHHAAAHTARRPGALRRFLIIALICAVSPIFALAATVAATGTMSVRVVEHQEGMNLWLPMPALLLDAAVFAVPMLMPEDELAQAREEVAPYLPALRQLSDALEDMPDADLVRVETRTETVRITKDGRYFTIHVDSPDADVRVTLPARMLGRTLDILG